nr:Hypothetical protein CBG10548 [Haemonchus contortus]
MGPVSYGVSCVFLLWRSMDKEEDATVHSAKRHCGHGSQNAAEAEPSKSNTQDMRNERPSAQKGKNSNSKDSKESKPMSCKRSAKSLIYVAFNRELSIFEVTKKRKNYLKIMGVPLKNGGHVLFPEEVLYLMEHWMVYATDGGRPLTLYDGIRILGETGVPFHKYRAYSALRTAGFAVLRPNRANVHGLPLREEITASTEASSSSSIHYSKECDTSYPRNLLDDFPTMKDSHLLVSSMLHHNRHLIPTEDLSNFPYNPHGFRVPHKPLRGSRRMLRPAYWPDFQPITSSVSSWKEYSRRRRTSIKSAKSAVRDRRNARSQNVRSEYDFEVFLADRFVHSVPERPAFRVICFDSRRGALNCAHAHRFAGDIPLILSIFDCGYICFIEISGESIDLNQYLENLRKGSQ